MTARIVIVEDERLVALALEERLAHLGYTAVASVASGQEAIETCERERPDLVLMDIRLGGALDGIETAAILKEELDVPCVFLTAYSDTATLERAKVLEPFGYLVKPFDNRLLEVTLRSRSTVERRSRSAPSPKRN